MIEGSATIGPTAQFTAMSHVVVNTKSGTAGTPTATKGTVSNNSVTVTPSVTNTTGWITGSTITGTDVTVSASELVSGALSIDDDGTYDVTNYASADVAIDYTTKAVPVTIYNNSTLPMATVFYSTFANGILNDGYISNNSTIAIPSNSSTSRYIPYGCNFVIRLGKTAVTNVDLQINDTIQAPIIEGKSSSGLYFRLYNLSKSVFTTSGTSMYIIDSTDPLKDDVTLDTLTATSNDTYTAPSGTAYSSVTVAVPAPTPSLQSKTAAPTESQQSITADSGYDGLSDVTVNAISSTYVGSGIDRRDSTDLTASGATVTVPAGYYENQASKAISSGSATPAATISGSSATVTTSANSITLSKTVSNTPVVSPGYISSGTAGNSDVSLTASVTTKAAQTYTPGTTDQTISANQYLTGAQTIKGDSNLIASNIAQGVTIFGVQGTHQGGGTPSLQAKTATPSASQQVITADAGYDGLSQVTVSGDSDLIAGNIKSGVNIFGVTGSYTGPSYTDGDNLAYGGN